MTDSSYVFFKGQSRIDGDPIVGIITGLTNPSRNIKTGQMYQVYIFVDNGLHPLDNVKSGADASICGDCDRRPYLIETGRSDLEFPCYLFKEMGRAVGAVWKAYKAGKIKTVGMSKVLSAIRYFERPLRLTTYGDPTAVPLDVWEPMIRAAAGHTGYSQFWNRPENSEYRRFFQASVFTAKQQTAAAALGWNTFRSDDTATDLDLAGRESRRRFMVKKEKLCPNPISKINNPDRRPITCAKCLLCAGTSKGRDLLVASH